MPSHPISPAFRHSPPGTRRSATPWKSSRRTACAGLYRRPVVRLLSRDEAGGRLARTALIRSREAHPREPRQRQPRSASAIRAHRRRAVASISGDPGTSCPRTGFGAFWGEVQTHVHAGLGCPGSSPTGSVRDLDADGARFRRARRVNHAEATPMSISSSSAPRQRLRHDRSG